MLCLFCNSGERDITFMSRPLRKETYFNYYMTIYPAIDLRGGRCVRLFQGKADQETVYFEDPTKPARLWKECGATHLHLVDLDGAFSGGRENLDAVKSILDIGGMKVQLGGGMRNNEAISQALELGLDRVILGTAACEDPEWTGRLIEEYGPDRIVIGIDARNGCVTTKGWVETTQKSAVDFAMEMEGLGARWIIHTDVATDGAMKGPNFAAQINMLKAAPRCKIIASGGVSKEQDVLELQRLAKEYNNLEGVIIGKALYENTVNLEKLI